jgi:hypothetical protein
MQLAPALQDAHQYLICFIILTRDEEWVRCRHHGAGTPSANTALRVLLRPRRRPRESRVG